MLSRSVSKLGRTWCVARWAARLVRAALGCVAPGPRAWVRRLVRRSSPEQLLTGGEKGKRRGEEERKERKKRKRGEKREVRERRERGREKKISSARIFRRSKSDYIAFGFFYKNTKNYQFTLYKIYGYHTITVYFMSRVL